MGQWNGIELDDMVLRGPRLKLRPWQAEDARRVEAIMADRAMHDFLPLPDPYTRTDAEQFVTGFGPRSRRDGTGISCAVVEEASSVLVAAAEMRLPAVREVSGEIGYWVAGDARAKGYAAEATQTLTSWAFEHGVRRLEIRCAVGNIASAKTALTSGFGFEGISRSKELTPRGPEDGALFARLGGDAGTPVEPVFAPLPARGLTDGTVALRGLAPGDADAVHAERSDPTSVGWGWDGRAPARVTSDQLAAHAALRWLVGPRADMAIVDVASDLVAGTLSLWQSGPPQVGMISYGVLPAFRGRRYTARALKLLTPWAFDVAGFARLELGAKVANVASQRSALAGGFTGEGVHAARLASADGTFSDEAQFAKLSPKISRSA